MHKLDAFSPLPHELVGKYDIVHLRLFIVLVRNNDPAPLLRNLIQMLSKKPCGLSGPFCDFSRMRNYNLLLLTRSFLSW